MESSKSDNQELGQYLKKFWGKKISSVLHTTFKIFLDVWDLRQSASHTVLPPEAGGGCAPPNSERRLQRQQPESQQTAKRPGDSTQADTCGAVLEIKSRLAQDDGRLGGILQGNWTNRWAKRSDFVENCIDSFLCNYILENEGNG